MIRNGPGMQQVLNIYRKTEAGHLLSPRLHHGVGQHGGRAHRQTDWLGLTQMSRLLPGGNARPPACQATSLWLHQPLSHFLSCYPFHVGPHWGERRNSVEDAHRVSACPPIGVLTHAFLLVSMQWTHPPLIELERTSPFLFCISFSPTSARPSSIGRPLLLYVQLSTLTGNSSWPNTCQWRYAMTLPLPRWLPAPLLPIPIHSQPKRHLPSLSPPSSSCQSGFHSPLPTSDTVLSHWGLPPVEKPRTSSVLILSDFSQHLAIQDHSLLPEIHFLLSLQDFPPTSQGALLEALPFILPP